MRWLGRPWPLHDCGSIFCRRIQPLPSGLPPLQLLQVPMPSRSGLSSGPFAEIQFSRDDLEQLRFASLLHGFGKIGVREHVLVKSHKLPPDRLELIRVRIDHALRVGELSPDQARAANVALMTLNDPASRPGELTEVGPMRVSPGGCVANTGGDLTALGATGR